MQPDLTILRRDPDGTLIALFPEYPADEFGYTVTSYEHIGQHGAAFYGRVVEVTEPVRDTTAPDVVRFLDELRRVGYDVALRQRETPSMRENRRRNVYR